MSYTKEDIIRIVKEEDIEFIRMQFVDIFGQLKNVAITASQIEKAVNNQITFDGSSIEGYTRINESDQYLYPDLNSFAIFPWRPAQGKVARLICDVYNPDGTPFVGDPRGVLRRVLQRSRDMGFDAFNIGPELEFFLFETDDQGHATTLTRDEAGYFDLGPLDHGESTRREICLNLEQMGFEIEASHHECARGQSTRVELRSPDPSCNPYLAVAACLAAGLDGIQRGLTPPPEITGNIYEMDDSTRAASGIQALPSSLEEALREMEADPVIMDVLGGHVASHYIHGKMKEWNEYCIRVSNWELEKYLVTY